MPPKATKTPLDRRLAANAGKEETSHWNISELKQNLQEDSAVLEQTLREANKLLGETTGTPFIDVGGVVNGVVPKDNAAGRKDGEGADGGGGTGSGGGTGVQQKAVAIQPVSGTFMTELDVSAVSNVPTVSLAGCRLSEELFLRLAVLEDVIGVDALQVLKNAVQSDVDQISRLSRAMAASSTGRQNTDGHDSIEDLEARIVEEEALKFAALESNRVLQENLRMQSTRLAEVQEKLALLDSTSQEGGEMLRKREAETKALKEELVAAQNKTRVEEGERLKLVDRLRKKDVEMTKSKETLDKMTMQLQRLGEERDHMQAQLEDTKARYHDLQQRCGTLQEELNKVQSAERVLKRNLQLQLPDEIKRVAKRAEELEKQNREMKDKAVNGKEDRDSAAQLKHLQLQVMELRVANKSLEGRLEEERKEKESVERKTVSERRMLQNRTKTLFEQNVRYTQKLQGETEMRIAERLHNRSSDNEVSSLRRRNLELLAQVNQLDEHKATAERKAAEAERKSRDLKEKLELYATVHRMDISRAHQPSTDLTTEAEMQALLGTRHLGPRGGARSATPSMGSRAKGASGTLLRQSSRGELSQRSLEFGQRSGTPPTVVAGQASVASSTGELARQSARAEVDAGDESQEASPEVLRQKVLLLQSKLAAEEKGRAAAQERVVALAEQMLDKDKELAALSSVVEAEKETKKRKRKGERLRELEAQVMSLITKLREAEMDKDQVDHKLTEKEEESRIKGRKISELIFKLQVEEEAKARYQEELVELRNQVARQGTSSGEGAAVKAAPHRGSTSGGEARRRSAEGSKSPSKPGAEGEAEEGKEGAKEEPRRTSSAAERAASPERSEQTQAGS